MFKVVLKENSWINLRYILEIKKKIKNENDKWLIQDVVNQQLKPRHNTRNKKIKADINKNINIKKTLRTREDSNCLLKINH